MLALRGSIHYVFYERNCNGTDYNFSGRIPGFVLVKKANVAVLV